MSDEEMRKRGYAEGAIRAVRFIEGLSTEELLLSLEDTAVGRAKHDDICRKIGPGTNRSWVTSRVAEELCFYRDAITVEQYDRIVD